MIHKSLIIGDHLKGSLRLTFFEGDQKLTIGSKDLTSVDVPLTVKELKALANFINQETFGSEYESIGAPSL